MHDTVSDVWCFQRENKHKIWFLINKDIKQSSVEEISKLKILNWSFPVKEKDTTQPKKQDHNKIVAKHPSTECFFLWYGYQNFLLRRWFHKVLLIGELSEPVNFFIILCEWISFFLSMWHQISKDLNYSFYFKSSTEKKEQRTCDYAVPERVSIK